MENESFLEGNGIIILILFFLMFGGGFGGWGANNSAMQNALTRAELSDGLNFQNLNNDIRSMQSQMCNSCNDIEQSILRSQYETANGICGINRNIDSAKYDALINTSNITQAIHADGEATRALITQNTIQQLRDEKQALNNELQSAQLTLANASQTQNILGNMGRFVPYAGCSNACGCSYGW